MGWQDLIVEIRVTDRGGSENVGTAFPVRKGRLLTARHTLFDNVKGEPEIRVRWNSYGPADEFHGEATFDDDGFCRATLLWGCDVLDVALIEVPHPRKAGVILMSGEPVGDVRACTSRGHPEASFTVEDPDSLYVHATVGAAVRQPAGAREAPCLEIVTYNRPSDPMRWAGLSGAPLVDNQTKRVLGVIVQAREKLEDGGHLIARPASAIVDHEGYKAHLGDDLRGHEIPKAFRETYLQQVRDTLIEELEWREEQTRSMLCGLATGNPHETEICAVKVADLILNNAETFLDNLQRPIRRLAGQNPEQAAMLGKIGQIAFLRTLDTDGGEDEDALRLISFLTANDDRSDGDPVPASVYTTTLLEIVAAALDRGVPDFPEQRVEYRLPAGRQLMSVACLEGGPGRTPDPATPLIATLAHRMGIRVEDAEGLRERTLRYLRDRNIVDGKDAEIVGERYDEILEQVSVALRRRRRSGHRSPYIAALQSGSGLTAAQVLDALIELRSKVPEILILGLLADDREARAEEDRIGPLINTIPLEEDRS